MSSNKNNKNHHSNKGGYKPHTVNHQPSPSKPINKIETQNKTTSEIKNVEDVREANYNEEQKNSNQKSQTGFQEGNHNQSIQTNKQDQTPPPQTTKKRNIIAAIGLISSAIVVGIIATLLGGKIRDEYIKPPAYAPDWLFPVVWSILYISIGIAGYIAFVSVQSEKKRKWDVVWYSIHLFFNFMWPLFYFTLNWLIFSCVWLFFVVITAIIVTYRYYKAHLAPGIIFTAYTMWLLYAMYLSLGVTILNA